MTPQRLVEIERLYQAALEHEFDRRETFLAEACGADEDLRQQVARLLAQSGSTRDLAERAGLPRALASYAEAGTALTAGARLGPYQIVSLLGEGGMGKVYRARDTRLGRAVAVKISTEQFSKRFEREARAISALNHPNICTLHDVGPNYLVMELVEGENLKGPLPLETALDYARQIADALEAAHEKGITHRDLKPGNIIVKQGGVVKVLDFGLAKMGDAPAARPDDSPTLTMEGTQTGVILGTPAYMAPEQALGQEVDRRADIWAFGVVLYEMLTGQKLFKGSDLRETLASAIKDEPMLEDVPAKVQRLLRSCLEKDPKRRLQAIGDWRFLLDEPAVPATAARPGVARWVWPAVASALAVALAALAYVQFREQPVDRPLARLDVDLGADVSLATAYGGSDVVISPDGTRLVYIASLAGGPASLFLRRLDQPKAAELPGTQGASAPFFSPEGQWVGFTAANGKLSKIPVEGGAPIPLADAGSSTGSSWGADGNMIDSILGRGLFRIPSVGGAAAPVELVNGETSFMAPQILPGAKAILFSVYPQTNDPDRARIEVLSLADHRRKIVAQGGTSARYVATSNKSGYLVYANRATLFAVPFDLDRLEKRGTPVAVLDDVGFTPDSYESQFDVSRSGTMVYRKAAAGSADPMATIQWMDAAGKQAPLVSKPGVYYYAVLSPDGKRLAVHILGGGRADIKVYDSQRETWNDLTSGGERLYWFPAWSRPDGQTVVFSSLAGTFWARADGASQPQPLAQDGSVHSSSAIAPNGKWLAYNAGNPFQIWIVPLENTAGQLKAGAPEPFFKDAFSNDLPAFSPDGKWLAYVSNSSGSYEVYVRAFPDNGSLWKISNNGAGYPIWSRNGHDLLYQSGDQEMAVSYSVNGNTFAQEKPRVWLAKVGGRVTDLSLDGKRLVVVTPVGSTGAPKVEHEVVLLQNFSDELRRRVPSEK